MLNTCATRFTDFLDSKDLRYDTKLGERGRSIVSFPYDGKVTKLYFSGDDGTYLSMYTIYESVPAEKAADILVVCNELNCKYKWVKFYLDDDNDLIVEADAILTVSTAADVAFELMLRLFDITGESKAKIMKAIYA